MDAFVVHETVKKNFENYLKREGITNLKLDVKLVTKPGDNYLGVISRAYVKGVQNGKPIERVYIIKSAMQNDTYRQITNIRNPYEREIFMYTTVFPEFLKMEREQGTLTSFSNIPKYFMSNMDEYQESIVMEDMTNCGYTLRNRMEPLDYNHVELMMKTYGKFHAISFALRDQKPELFERIAKNTGESMFCNLSDVFIDSQENNYCGKAMEALQGDKYKKYRECFEYYKENNRGTILKRFKMAEKEKYAVVNHGDSWINNILFKYDDKKQPNKPTDICLIDFQMSKMSSPAVDLSYFIFACTSKQLRDKFYDKMLKIYYYSLCEHLVELGSDPEKLFPFEALEEQMKKYSVVGYFFVQMVMYLMMSNTEDVPDMNKDHNESDMLDFKSANDEKYKERIRDVIIDYVDKGYFDVLKKKK